MAHHELDINPWIHFYSESYDHTLYLLEKTQKLLKRNNFNNIAAVADQYFQKMNKLIVKYESKLMDQDDSRPIMSLLELMN